MSIPVPTRLYWSQHEARLFVKMNDTELSMRTAAPLVVEGLPERVTHIDYFGTRGEFRVASESRTEMSRAQSEACLRFLERIAAAACTFLGLKEKETP